MRTILKASGDDDLEDDKEEWVDVEEYTEWDQREISKF